MASVALAVYIIYRNIRDKDIRPWRALFIVAMMIVLCHSGKLYDFVGLRIKDTYLFDYRTLWLALLSILLIVPPVYKVIARWIESKKLRSNNNGETVVNPGFITDTVNLGQSVDDNFKSYAGTIVKRLLGTDLSEKSFAVGITGEWGSGKSTFLNSLRAAFKENGEFKNQAEIVEFNPWMCQSPEQVIADFFNALREQLSPRHSRLSRPIKEYASVLNAIATSTSLDLITKVNSLWPKDKSLQKKKEHLSQQLRKIDKPVVVFIDDLDRLESREVFEVLRLVRNTGDLCNMIYIVAYDKDYLVSVLSENSIQNGSTYLEKIFPVELPLPKIGSSDLPSVFMKCLSKQRRKYPKSPELSDRINFLISTELFNSELEGSMFDFDELIPKVLRNYRRVRNFSRKFILLVDLYEEKGLLDKIYLRDLLGIELLEIHDKDTFDRLGRNPESILTRWVKRYAFLEENKTYIHPKRGNEDSSIEVTVELLTLLFGEKESEDVALSEGVPLKSIKDISNFHTYFQFSLPKDILTETEFNEIFKKEANIKKIVTDWAENKSPNSVLTRFNDSIFYIKNDSSKQKAYLDGVLFLFDYEYAWIDYESHDFCKLIEKKRFSKGVMDDLKLTLLDWFRGINDYKWKSSLLNALYGNHEENNRDCLIDKSEIENLLRENMKSFLESDSNLDLKECFTDQDAWRFRSILKNSCVYKGKDATTDDEIRENVTIDVIIDHFSKQEKKYTRKELRDAIEEIIDNEISSLRNSLSRDNEDDDDVFNESLVHDREWYLIKYFGSDFKAQMEELIEKCSLPSDEHTEKSMLKDKDMVQHVNRHVDHLKLKKDKKSRRHKE